MVGQALRGVRWMWLQFDTPREIQGLREEFPYLPADSTVVGVVIHSHQHALTRFDAAAPASLASYPLPLPSFAVAADDVRFGDSPAPGPRCLCSRCLTPIDGVLPIRHVGGDGLEYRYHPQCVGLADPPAIA